MNISKTLFKNLTRCPSFMGLYDLYLNRTFNEVKTIDGKKINQELLDDILNLDDNLFNEEQEKLQELLYQMFDDSDGHDLLEQTNPQMEAFKDVYKEVEMLAAEHVEALLGKSVQFSDDTHQQKKFSYRLNGNEFYCYLDIYYEDEKSIKVFEVKTTTSSKFDDLHITKNKQTRPLFIKKEDHIFHLNKTIEPSLLQNKLNKIADRYGKVGKYIYDIAIQRHIIENSMENAGKNVDKKVEYYLVVLDAKYRFSGKYDENNQPLYLPDQDGNELFNVYDVTELTTPYQEQILNERTLLFEWQENLAIKTNVLGKHCQYKETTQCKFCPVCMKKVLKDGSILEYLDKHRAFFVQNEKGRDKRVDVYDLINQGLTTIPDAKPYLRKPNNLMQCDTYENNYIYINKPQIEASLANISYPIYYLDFESYNSPLPRFFQESPYMQSLFQYSLHVEKAKNQCDLVKDHKEFLAKDHLDHREELIKQLIEDIDLSQGGTVIVYNKSFEQTRLKELARIFPKYQEALYNIHDHIYDLLDSLKGKADQVEDKDTQPTFNYYHPLLHGSFSIKKVLPLFSDLSYQNLEVKNGTEAIVTYGMLPYLTEQEYKEKYLALSVYCRQDTWAMVEILRGLYELIKNPN